MEKKHRVPWNYDVDLGHGGQQQASDSSASGANRGGKGIARSTQDGGMGRRRRQIETLVVGVGLGTDWQGGRWDKNVLKVLKFCVLVMV